MKDLAPLLVLGLLLSMGAALEGPSLQAEEPKRFSSYWELVDFIKSNSERAPVESFEFLPLPAPAFFSMGKPAGARDVSPEPPLDFSRTNVQVKGVDEPDFIKCDGRYIYIISNGSVVIMEAYPPEAAGIISRVEVSNPRRIFVSDDRLVVFGDNYVWIYDISSRLKPKLQRRVTFSGMYFDSRFVGDWVYVITIQPVEIPVDMPKLLIDGEVKAIKAFEVYYFDSIVPPYAFVTILAINVRQEEVEKETFLAGAQTLFVSRTNVYLTHPAGDKTIIHRISIADGSIEYKAKGEVQGRVLNQFSMDEHRGYFRIATTTGWFGANHLYLLDLELNVVGKLEGLAPGERIYSARFMGDRAYLVTFKKVDPLFVIDLKDPKNPRVLGKLKIPGYSDYLHPYDENHLIGLGKNTVEAKDGNFAWYQGLKLALFDVSDPESPRELSKVIIGDRGTESYALWDHKAFLFSKAKGLLVIPVLLAERGSKDLPPSALGEYTWQGAYVFRVSPENGFVLQGRITHLIEGKPVWRQERRFVKRSLYIEDVLYTLSSYAVKLNSLENLEELGLVELSA